MFGCVSSWLVELLSLNFNILRKYNKDVERGEKKSIPYRLMPASVSTLNLPLSAVSKHRSEHCLPVSDPASALSSESYIIVQKQSSLCLTADKPLCFLLTDTVAPSALSKVHHLTSPSSLPLPLLQDKHFYLQ